MARLAWLQRPRVGGDVVQRPRQAERVARELDAAGVGQVLAAPRDRELHAVGGQRGEDGEHEGDDHEDGAGLVVGVCRRAAAREPPQKLQRRKKSATRAIMPTRMPTSVAKRMS